MSECQDPEDRAPTNLKHDLIQLDSVFDSTNLDREFLAEKLKTAITGIQVFDTADPKLIGAQMGLVNTYLAVLNGKEGNASRRVSSKLKQLETETASKSSAAVAELLSKVTMSGINFSLQSSTPHDPTTADRLAEAAFERSGLEPILSTELKTDPNDLS